MHTDSTSQYTHNLHVEHLYQVLCHKKLVSRTNAWAGRRIARQACIRSWCTARSVDMPFSVTDAPFLRLFKVIIVRYDKVARDRGIVHMINTRARTSLDRT